MLNGFLLHLTLLMVCTKKTIALYSDCAHSGIGTCALANSAVCELLARVHV